MALIRACLLLLVYVAVKRYPCVVDVCVFVCVCYPWILCRTFDEELFFKVGGKHTKLRDISMVDWKFNNI